MLQVPTMIEACATLDDARAERALAMTSKNPRDDGCALGETGGRRGVGGDAADDLGRARARSGSRGRASSSP